MYELMEQTLALCSGEFADLRHECDRVTQIKYAGSDLSTVSESERDGFHLRVLKNGGLGSYTLNEAAGLPDALRKAEQSAALSGEYNDPPIRFKPGPKVVECLSVDVDDDSRSIPLDAKVSVLKHYRDLVLEAPGIQTANLSYVEWAKDKTLCNTLGTRIVMEEVISFITGEIIAKDGTRIENVRVEIGGAADFSLLRSREEVFEQRARLASDLLRARPVEPGAGRVLLNPSMVGVFIHEAFGHFSEADIVKDNPSLLKKLKLQQRLAADHLSVVDDPTLSSRPGFKVYDDEGVRCVRTDLIKNGILVGRLHNMQTAQQLDEELTGNAVAVGCSHPPIVRMSNIYVAPGEHSFDDLLSMLGDGLYICDHKGGSTMGDQFAFGAQHGYIVEKGKLSQMVSGITMSGNLFNTMDRIVAVGNDLEFAQSGGCGKAGQMNPQSGTGGPHLLIDPVILG